MFGVSTLASSGAQQLSADVVSRQREIVFAVETGDQRDLAVMAANGSDVRRVTGSPADEFSPTWQSVGATGPSPSPSGITESTAGLYVHAEASGDFDGDGLPDRAELFDEVPRGETCHQDVSPYLRIEVRLAAGEESKLPSDTAAAERAMGCSHRPIWMPTVGTSWPLTWGPRPRWRSWSSSESIPTGSVHW